jgi:multiple sugar transport system substrate-binding protein
MNKKFFAIILGCLLIFNLTPIFAGGEKEEVKEEGVTEIVYWQYFYETKKNLMDDLIGEFEAANPTIKVTQQTFPYADYNTKVAASVPSGKGPNVINLYYGWLPKYVTSGYLQPLTGADFTPAKVESEFFPLVKAAKFDGSYYALPTAVRSLALFYNKDLLAEGGYSAPPKTWEEAVEMGKDLAEFDKNGNFLQIGFGVNLDNQFHHVIREVLNRQMGTAPYNEDSTQVLYNNQAGYDAMKFVSDLELVEKTGRQAFMEDDRTAFKAGTCAMFVSGSFALGTLDKVEELNYGTAELPSMDGMQSNFASFWANGITSFTEGKELVASEKFLQFLTSADVMERWLAEIGELPANMELGQAEKIANDPKFGPFIRGLEYAHATVFYDESAQKSAMFDAYNRIVLQGMDVKESVDIAAKEEQAVIDKYFDK